MAKTAIIIGAGLGGMATAIRLARDGWHVTVLEKNVRVGGKLDCHGDQGFLWDIGPSLVTMPFVLRELFEYAGHDIENYLELVPLDPICRYFYPDGKAINSWANFHHFQIEVARREKDHGEALEKFVHYSRGIYHFMSEAQLFHPPAHVWGYLGLRFLKQLRHLPKILSTKSMAQVVESHFKDPHLRQLFLSYATHLGSSPYRAPAVLNLLSYLEIQGGGWYVQGGVYRLAEALEKCARDLHVKFLVDAEVSEITFQSTGSFGKPRAKGVLIRGGVALEADAIICNADAMHVWARLLHTKNQAAVSRRLDRKPFSTSPFVILLGVKHRYEKLAHHNIFFSSDYPKEFDDLFLKKRLSHEPTIHLSISSRSDPTQAPAGQDNYYIFVHTPPLEPDHHWEKMHDSYRNLILERLEKMGLENLKDHIVCEKIITPAEFASRTKSYRGAICGHATHSLSGLWNRPSNRCAEVKGLYFVGSTTQPGGGMPSTLLSAQRVCNAIKHDTHS